MALLLFWYKHVQWRDCIYSVARSAQRSFILIPAYCILFYLFPPSYSLTGELYFLVWLKLTRFSLNFNFPDLLSSISMPISSWITRLHFCVFLRLQGCENLFSSHGNPSCFQLHLKLLENCWTFSCLLWLGLVMSRSVSLMPSHTFSNGTLSPIFIKGITEPFWGRFSTF